MSKDHERLKISNGKHLTVETHTTVNEHPIHWHSFFEIEIILDGEGKYVINDVVYDMSEYNVFLLTSTDFHYLNVKDRSSMINISFDEELLDEGDLGMLLHRDRKRAYRFEDCDYKRLVSAAELLRNECETNGDCQRQLLQYIVRQIMKKDRIKAETAAEHISGIKKAIVYMELHFKERISLAELAAEAGYHPTYFSELFKKVTGESYSERLNTLRTGYAKGLLARGFSVTEACYGAGFGSLSNFLRVFKKNVGISPEEYRRNNT